MKKLFLILIFLFLFVSCSDSARRVVEEKTDLDNIVSDTTETDLLDGDFLSDSDFDGILDGDVVENTNNDSDLAQTDSDKTTDSLNDEDSQLSDDVADTDSVSDASDEAPDSDADAVVLKKDGETCSGNSECSSNFCVDGVCCNNACDGTCESCSISGKEGTCSPFQQGTDPDKECDKMNAESCGFTGFCDGKSACEFYDQKTPCITKCSQDKTSILTAKVCDGKGNCSIDSLDEISCKGYLCVDSTTTCLTSCKADGIGKGYCDILKYYCSSHKCVPLKDKGKSCDNDYECKSHSCSGMPMMGHHCD